MSAPRLCQAAPAATWRLLPVPPFPLSPLGVSHPRIKGGLKGDGGCWGTPSPPRRLPGTLEGAAWSRTAPSAESFAYRQMRVCVRGGGGELFILESFTRFYPPEAKRGRERSDSGARSLTHLPAPPPRAGSPLDSPAASAAAPARPGARRRGPGGALPGTPMSWLPRQPAEEGRGRPDGTRCQSGVYWVRGCWGR